MDDPREEKKNIHSIEINKYKSNDETPKTSYTDIQNSEVGENEDQFGQIQTSEINCKIGISSSVVKRLEEKILLLTNQLSDVKNDLLFSEIERIYDKIEILEKLVLDSKFKLVIIDIECKKSQYIKNIVISLKNIINNFANPYNFNLWRKLANIILKNIFLVLNKKNYIIYQNLNTSILTKLKSYASKIPIEKQKSYNQKVDNYEIKLKEQNKNISSASNSAADKDRNFNIIIIEKNPKYSLSIDFLFYLKEKGNKINHFNKEVIDLILFEDLNIKVIKKEEKKEYNIEQENDNINEKFLFKGKTEFNGSEIIEMLKSPFKYHKEEIDINSICSYIYNEINNIKK